MSGRFRDGSIALKEALPPEPGPTRATRVVGITGGGKIAERPTAFQI